MGETATSVLERLRSGDGILALLLALYYSTVVLAGSHFTVLQIVVLWGLVLLCMPRYHDPLTRNEFVLLLSVTAIFFVALCSYAVNELWDHPAANLSRYARFLFFVPIYLVVRRFSTEENFWSAVLVGAWCTGVWAVLEFAGIIRHPDDYWRHVNGNVNPIQFGDLSLTMAMMVAAGLPFYRQHGRSLFAVAVIAVALGLFGSVASFVRGAWISIPVMVLLVIGIHVYRGFLKPLPVLALGFAAAVAIGAMMPRTEFIEEAQEIILDIRDYRPGEVKVSDVGYRFEMWRASWTLFKPNPWLGVGPGLYHDRVSALAEADDSFNRHALRFSHPHSEYFFQLATLGAMGIAALALLFFVPLYRFARAMLSRDDGESLLGLAGAVVVLGYLQFGLTEGLLFQHATFLGFYLLTVAVLSVLIGRKQSESTMEKGS